MRRLLKELKKMWLDTLTNPETGKYGRKSVTWFVGILLFITTNLVSMFSGDWAPEYVYMILTAFILGMGALTVWDKKPKDVNHRDETVRR